MSIEFLRRCCFFSELRMMNKQIHMLFVILNNSWYRIQLYKGGKLKIQIFQIMTTNMQKQVNGYEKNLRLHEEIRKKYIDKLKSRIRERHRQFEKSENAISDNIQRSFEEEFAALRDAVSDSMQQGQSKDNERFHYNITLQFLILFDRYHNNPNIPLTYLSKIIHYLLSSPILPSFLSTADLPQINHCSHTFLISLTLAMKQGNDPIEIVNNVIMSGQFLLAKMGMNRLPLTLLEEEILCNIIDAVIVLSKKYSNSKEDVSDPELQNDRRRMGSLLLETALVFLERLREKEKGKCKEGGKEGGKEEENEQDWPQLSLPRMTMLLSYMIEFHLPSEQAIQNEQKFLILPTCSKILKILKLAQSSLLEYLPLVKALERKQPEEQTLLSLLVSIPREMLPHLTLEQKQCHYSDFQIPEESHGVLLRLVTHMISLEIYECHVMEEIFASRPEFMMYMLTLIFSGEGEREEESVLEIQVLKLMWELRRKYGIDLDVHGNIKLKYKGQRLEASAATHFYQTHFVNNDD